MQYEPVFFFQAEDGIRDAQESRGLGDVYKRQALDSVADPGNLGTILRTHDSVGGQGVILLDQSTDLSLIHI